jgi:hypothetical protein
LDRIIIYGKALSAILKGAGMAVSRTHHSLKNIAATRAVSTSAQKQRCPKENIIDKTSV